MLTEFTLLYKRSSCAAGDFEMRVILNPLMPNKDGYLMPVKPSQVYHCDNINQFVTQYEESKGNPDKKIKYPTPAQYKKEYEFLKEVDSLALANAQMNLDKAYKNFFRDKSIGFPKFKSKKNPVQSYTTNNQNGTVNIFENWLKVPKLKELVKIKVHRKIEGIIKSATISRNGSGKYFISLLCETDIQELPKTNSSVGIDLGIKDLAILSTGEKGVSLVNIVG
nr:MAG: helix-turn-helix domain protein [Bacteriophage sp.]